MLEAREGNVTEAAILLEASVVWRLNHEDMMRSLHCEPVSDMRILGIDKLNRPLIYFCGASQVTGGNSFKDQVIVTFERASRLVDDDGHFTLILDMYGIKLRMNMDMPA